MPTVAVDAGLMAAFCRDKLPRLIQETCGTELATATTVGEDVLAVAEDFACLAPTDQNVLAAPYVEEVFDDRPHAALPRIKAAVAVVLRNSRLADLLTGADPADRDRLGRIAEQAAEPLSHLIVAREQQQPASGPRTAHDGRGTSAFATLPSRYPRAWACLSALDGCLAEGGPGRYRSPEGPVPELTVGGGGGGGAGGGTDGAASADRLSRAAAGPEPLFVAALSDLSRDAEAQLRQLEFLLAHGVTILTTNYLLRPADVSVRRRALLLPDFGNPARGLDDVRGLSGVHRAVAARVRDTLAART